MRDDSGFRILDFAAEGAEAEQEAEQADGLENRGFLADKTHPKPPRVKCLRHPSPKISNPKFQWRLRYE